MTRYVSTRGYGIRPADMGKSFIDAVLDGLAPDGGLYMPLRVPKIGSEELNRWRGYSLADVAYWVLERYIGDVIPPRDLHRICHEAYGVRNFPNGRIPSSAALPVHDVYPGLFLAELSNGPTLAFKDYGTLFLGRLYAYLYLNGHVQKPILVIVATSGDTGGATINALRGLPGVIVVCLSPDRRVTDEQAAQMYSVTEENVHNLVIRGNFDDCQRFAKALLLDAGLRERFQMGSANSINIARVVAQVVYHVYVYLAVTDHCGQLADYIVQSGNMGNGVSALLARQMGVPIRSVTLVSNENDTFPRFLETGRYQPKGKSVMTSSSAQDVDNPSNNERFLYMMTGGQSHEVKRLMDLLRDSGTFDVSGEPYWIPSASRYDLFAESCLHTDRLAIVRRVYREKGIILDSHTANAFAAALVRRNTGKFDRRVPTVVFETAQPAKFADFVREALHIDPPVPESLRRILALPRKYRRMPNNFKAVKTYVDSVGVMS